MRVPVASLTKKLISTFFAVTLAFGLVPAAAFADEDAPVDDASVISSRISEDVALEPIAQKESVCSFFLANTAESARSVPMTRAELSLNDEVTAESTVVSSFSSDGMTYAIEPGGESVALVAVDYRKLPEDFIQKQILAIPDAVSPDGIEAYSVTRIAAGALASLTKGSADASYVGCEALLADEGLLAEAGIDADELARTLDPEQDMVDMDGDGEIDAVADPLKGCVGILALGIPASVTSIEDGAFAGSDTLQYLVVSDDNPTYASFDGALYSADLATLRLIPEGRVGAVRIAPDATDVDPEVFSHCPFVDAVVADADSAAFYSNDGCLYAKNTDELIWKSKSTLRDRSLEWANELERSIADVFSRDPEVLEESSVAYSGSELRADPSSLRGVTYYNYAAYALTGGSFTQTFYTHPSTGDDTTVTEGLDKVGIFGTALNDWWIYLGDPAVVVDIPQGHYRVVAEIHASPGYRFSGWSSSSSGPVNVSPGTKVSGDSGGGASFWANFEKLPTYRVFLDANSSDATGGTSQVYHWLGRGFVASSVSTTVVTAGQVIAPELPSRPGYAFMGYWDTASSSGGTRYIDEKGRVVGGTPLLGSKDVTLYARWSLNTYSVTYQDGAGSALSGWATGDGSSLPATFTVVSSAEERRLPSMVKRGYTWKGWLYEGAPVTSIPDVSKNITIVADFEADPYAIEVDLTGGVQTGWHEGAFEGLTYDDPILTLPDNDANLKRPGYVFSHFVAHREGSDEEASVLGRDDAGAYTVPTARLIPGESYQVLNLGSGEDIYDIASIEAVWTARIAIDVPTRASLGILIDAATDTVRFRANETSYTGDATDVYAELAFTSYTTAPIGIVEVAEDTADPGYAERAALAQEVFGPKMGDVTITLSDAEDGRHALPLGGKTTLSSEESHLAGLVLDAADASPSKKTFYLGMGLSSLRASDVATNRSGDIAKLFYTVALLDDDGDPASDPSRLEGYDGEGVVW